MHLKLLNRVFCHTSTVAKLSIEKTSTKISNMAEVLDGKKLAEELNKKLKENIAEWSTNNNMRKPTLRCVLVGDNPASESYIRIKSNAAEYVGIESKTIRLDKTTSEQGVVDKVNELNQDPEVDGILVQLPLPDGIDERKICNTVAPEKDVDGFHVNNVGKLCLDMVSMVPCTPLGVLEIIKSYGIETHGRNVVVVGRSKNVGMPIAMLLHTDARHDSHLGMDATVTICHRYTPKEQLKFFCQNADIIISAAGIPGLITADMVKQGAAVIDVGLTRIKLADTDDTKLVGDVDYKCVSKVAGAITPVPGGVGPMTVAMLMRNTFEAAKRRASRNQ